MIGDLAASALGLPTPRYLHLPVAVDASGAKLSKQAGSPALDPGAPVPALWRALTFLGQAPPARLAQGTPAEFWAFALANWTPERLPRIREIPWEARATSPSAAHQEISEKPS